MVTGSSPIVQKCLARTVRVIHQGHTKDEARASLIDAIALILTDRRDDGLRGVPEGAERETITVDIRGAA